MTTAPRVATGGSSVPDGSAVGTELAVGTGSAVSALVQHTGADGEVRWWRFRRPLAVFAAGELDAVLPQLAEVEAAVARGRLAVGFLSYEAGPAFDPAIRTRPRTADDPPLSWWALFEAPEVVPGPRTGDDESAIAGLAWRPLLSRDRHREAIGRIRDLIAAGETYQVNYTYALEAAAPGDPAALFAALTRAQRARHCAFVDTGRWAVCSASPELFFALDGERIVSRPMKGTARRGRFPAEDRRRREGLASSPKDRAENVMIVDMVRHDLGRIAEVGSVRVGELCAVETYPTVHQLTSTVGARTAAPLVEILRALYPCASITGAPKIRTTEIIRDLEVAPRGIYTGTVGVLGPGRRAQLNVAIRTAVVDRRRGVARYGTGGGVVWDSDAESEYDECRAKSLVLAAARPRFQLLETLLWRPKSGYFLLDRHLDRLRASAEYFAFPHDDDSVAARLAAAARDFDDRRTRVRLRLDEDGGLEVEAVPDPCPGRTTWRVVLDDRPVDSADPFLFHKTTHRRTYDEALRRHPEADEVLLWNERGELTESTRANLVLRIGDEWLTPAVGSGLLAGTYRAALLERGRTGGAIGQRHLRERVLPKELLRKADDIFLVNSVRGWIRTVLRVGR